MPTVLRTRCGSACRHERSRSLILKIEYVSRRPAPTASLAAEFATGSIAAAAERLGNWAISEKIAVGGSYFVTIAGGATCRVQLPVLTEVGPHGDSGIINDAGHAGAVAQVCGVLFEEVRTVADALLDIVGPASACLGAEFHPGPTLMEGCVVVPVRRAVTGLPTDLFLPGLRPTASAKTRGPASVITLARQHGTGGEAIAEAVADRLGYRVVDSEVIQMAAREAGVDAETLREAAVHRSLFTRLIDQFARGAIAGGDTWMPPVPLRLTPLFTSADYRGFVEEAIRGIAEKGRVLILGHGAQLALAARPDTLRVLVTGGMQQRVARAIAGGTPAADATRLIRQADAERLEYFREFYHEGWLDPASYDVVVNTDRLTPQEATQLILTAAGRKT